MEFFQFTMSLIHRANRAVQLVAEGRITELGWKIEEQLRAGLYSEERTYGLRRDLQAAFKPAAAKIPLIVREISGRDIARLFPDGSAHGARSARRELAWRHHLVRAQFPTCFVAVDQLTGEPCHMQWLTGAKDNARLREIGFVPMLQPDEAVIENVYTPPPYRGLGIMSAAMGMIAERAAEFGARHVITFVSPDNIPSLKGCRKAGFTPYVVRCQIQLGCRLMRRWTFQSLPDDAEASYLR